MANAAGNPHIIDTGSSTITATQITLRRVRWVGATTAGHTAILTNTAGVVVWASEAPAANYVEESAPGIGVLGLKVTTLASGKLYIYTD